LSAARCYTRFLEAGIPKERMSITSDGQGSLPVFDAGGRMIGLGVGTCASLAAYLAEAQIELGLSWEDALAPITNSPAQILKLPRKGRLAAGMDADLLALDADCRPVTVVARGRLLMQGGRLLVAGTFETADTL
jgi:beta-aspartyl-dipeptidase (metallo-type)